MRNINRFCIKRKFCVGRLWGNLLLVGTFYIFIGFLHWCKIKKGWHFFNYFLSGVLRDSWGKQLSSSEGAAGETEGDQCAEEEAGGQGAAHPAAGEAHQVSGRRVGRTFRLCVLSSPVLVDWWTCSSRSGERVSPESPCGLSARGSESSAEVDVQSSAVEADQDVPDEHG